MTATANDVAALGKTVSVTVLGDLMNYSAGSPDSATLTIQGIAAIPDAVPVHGLDTVTIPVLENDINATPSPITVSGWTQPGGGTLTFDPATQSFTFTPDSRMAFANNTFTYTITSGTVSSSATVTIERVFWRSPSGGNWADPTNWNYGLLPDAEDEITLGVPVDLPMGFGATVWGVHTTGASLAVDGALTVNQVGQFAGPLDVTSFGIVNNNTPDAAGGSFTLTGGAEIEGVLNTAAGSVTSFLGGATYDLWGMASDLTGDGLFNVFQASTLNVGTTQSVANLTVQDSSVTGPADLTVTGTLTAQTAIFSGLVGSVVKIAATGLILAPVPAGGAAVILDGKGITVLAGGADTISGDVELRNSAKIENNGILQVTGNSTISGGPGNGKVENNGAWQLVAKLFTVKVPFTNTGDVLADNGVIGDGRVTTFDDFTQYSNGTTTPSVSLSNGAQLKLETATILAGVFTSNVVPNPQAGQPPIHGIVFADGVITFHVTSAIRTGMSGVEFSAGPARNDTNLVAAGTPAPVVLFDFGSLVSLYGYTVWSSGDIVANSAFIYNFGQFIITQGNTIQSKFPSVFRNYSQVVKTEANALAPQFTEIDALFTNEQDGGSVTLRAGELRFAFKSEFFAPAFLQDNTRLVISGATTINKAISLAGGSQMIFRGAASTLKDGAQFVGLGTVSVLG